MWIRPTGCEEIFAGGVKSISHLLFSLNRGIIFLHYSVLTHCFLCSKIRVRTGIEMGVWSMKPLLFTKELPDQPKEKILYSAMHLFVSKGYKETSILDVVEMARISKTTFYNFFRRKDELLARLFDQLADEFLREVEKAIHVERKVAYKGYAGIRRYMELCKDHQEIAQVLLITSVGISPEVEGVRRKAHHRFAGMIHDTVRSILPDGISDSEMELVSQAMVGAIHEVVIQRLMSGEEEVEVESVARLLNRIAVGSFTALALDRNPPLHR